MGGKIIAVIASASGASVPAPTAWITRKATSAWIVGATAQRSEPNVKTDSPITKNRRRPNWSARRPIETSSTANMML